MAAAFGLAILFAIQAYGLETRTEFVTEPYLHTINTHQIVLEDGYIIEREYAGLVQAGQTSQLGFELGGRVKHFHVNEGDVVTTGQVLASLDTGLLESQRDELTANTDSLQAELDLARRNLARVARLQSERLASEREHDELASRVKVLEASLRKMAASLEANMLRLEKSELRSPFNARIGRRNADTGVVVDAGSPVFTLVQSGALEVRVGIPVAVSRHLETGDWLKVRLDKQESSGQLISLGPVVDQATRSRSLRISVTEDWTPGELAYVQLKQFIPVNGSWVPDTAVTEGVRGTWIVYSAVDSGDSRALLESRSIVIHHASGNKLYVSGALNQKDQVVSAGLHRLAPGQEVRVESQRSLASLLPPTAEDS
jgi:RND family efflux transporter MFP subunit